MHDFHASMAGLEQPTEFLFVRHGQSEGNAAGLMQGHREYPLSDKGREQARAAGEWLAAEFASVDAVFASPLSRAWETASIIASAADYPRPTRLDSAKELDTGVFSGLSFPEIQETYPDEYAEFLAGSWEVVPDAESASDLAGRAIETWDTLVASANQARPQDDEPARIVTVSHGGMLQWILKTSMGVTPDQPGPWMPIMKASNCGIFQLSARPVRSTDKQGNPLVWYYAQWTRINYVASMAST